MEINKVNSIIDNLKKYDYLAKEDDYIQVTEWSNGEGYDICIDTKYKTKIFSLTLGEVDALDFLIKSLTFK